MDTLRDSLGRHSREVLPIAVRVFIALYILVTIAHVLLLPASYKMPMVALSATSALVGILVLSFLRTVFVQRNAQAIAFVLVGIVAINAAVHLYLSGEIKHTTNHVVMMVAAAYVLPGLVAFWSIIVALVASWLMTAFQIASPDVPHYGFELFLGVMVAMFVHFVRRRQLTQMLELEKSFGQVELANAALSQGQKLVEELLNKIPAGIHVREMNGDMIFVNDEAKKIAGQAQNDEVVEYPRSGSFEMYDADLQPLDGEQVPFLRVQKGGEVRDEVVAIRGAAGDLFWGLLNMFPMRMDSLGKEVIVTTFVNITDRRVAETQLREAETRARLILRSVVDGVIAYDTTGTVTLFNDAASRLTGWTEKAAFGKSIEEVFPFTQDSGLSSSEIKTGTLTTRSGDEVSIELVISELGTEGVISGSVLTFRDVSEQIKVEQERATLDKMSSIGVLAGGIAHDFNNLLTSVYGNITLAEHHIQDTSRALSFLKQSADSIDQATNLTSQLLTFAKGSEPVRETVDLERLVRESVRLSLSGSGIAVVYSVSPDLSAASVDPGQMQQAINNVVLNAKQAMNDDGLLRISMRNAEREAAAEGPKLVEVVIEDQGPGIDNSNLSKIFDPYFTTKDGGSGLGLATTHSILMKHGGSISVSSEGSEGSRFVLSVPAAEKPLLLSEQKPEQEDDAPQIGGLSILIMDDEETVRQTMQNLLEHYGHVVTPTRHGEEAIEAFRWARESGKPFDLIIMDLTIAGGMGGKEAAEHILTTDPEALIIVASGYSAGAELAHYEELGFCARLDKPFRAEALQALVSETIAAHRR